MHGVMITTFIEKMKLKNATPELDTDKIVLSHPEVNRPALQLAGFFDHFDHERVQIVGTVERAYVSTRKRNWRFMISCSPARSPAWCIAGGWNLTRTSFP